MERIQVRSKLLGKYFRYIYDEQSGWVPLARSPSSIVYSSGVLFQNQVLTSTSFFEL